MVGTHTVHAEGDETDLLAAPLGRAVEVALSLPTALNRTRHYEMGSGLAHEGDTVLELVTESHYLMLHHMIRIIRVVVTLDGDFQAKRLCKLRHGNL